MTKIVAVAVLAAMTMLGTVSAVASMAAATGGRPPSAAQGAGSPPQARMPEGGVARQEVSRKQYDILIGQCRYAKSPEARQRCRTQVREQYKVGAFNPDLDCRTYSGITVCGVLELSAAQRSCVEEAVNGGLTRRRAEVECYAFR